MSVGEHYSLCTIIGSIIVLCIAVARVLVLNGESQNGLVLGFGFGLMVVKVFDCWYSGSSGMNGTQNVRDPAKDRGFQFSRVANIWMPFMPGSRTFWVPFMPLDPFNCVFRVNTMIIHVITY